MGFVWAGKEWFGENGSQNGTDAEEEVQRLHIRTAVCAPDLVSPGVDCGVDARSEEAVEHSVGVELVDILVVRNQCYRTGLQ